MEDILRKMEAPIPEAEAQLQNFLMKMRSWRIWPLIMNRFHQMHLPHGSIKAVEPERAMSMKSRLPPLLRMPGIFKLRNLRNVTPTTSSLTGLSTASFDFYKPYTRDY